MVWRTRADAWTRGLEVQRTNRQTHDLGFKFMPSYGQAYRLTEEGRRVLAAQRQGWQEFVRAIGTIAGVEYA